MRTFKNSRRATTRTLAPKPSVADGHRDSADAFAVAGAGWQFDPGAVFSSSRVLAGRHLHQFRPLCTPQCDCRHYHFSSALSVSAAIFLITELDSPFSGLLRISNLPLQNAIAHIGK